MSFHCASCDQPIIGDAVCEDYCVRCLMGADQEYVECSVCGGPVELSSDDDTCESCQELLDMGDDPEDNTVLDFDDEEFLRGPSF